MDLQSDRSEPVAPKRPSEIDQRKDWLAPSLKVLAVPSKTKGGGGDINDQDDIFYVTS